MSTHAALEIPPITFGRIEQSYRLMTEWRKNTNMRMADLGMRAARARDPKLLLALDKAYETMVAAYEAQGGETQRRASTTYAEKAVPTQVAMFREAYLSVDQSRPIDQLSFVYAGACWLAGII